MATETGPAGTPLALLERSRHIAATAASHAESVDRDARFPLETIEAIRSAKLLGAGVPAVYGGSGCSLMELSMVCETLGEACASSAMILAMHYIQTACLVEQAPGVPELEEYLQALCADQRLIASVTSEVGTDGDLRRSIAHVCAEPDGCFRFTKQATTISYGEYADDLLVTLRRAEEAPAHDQCLVLVLRGSYEITNPSTWDTLGMRGTCSPGGRVEAHGSNWQILRSGFGDIAARTMVPYSHVLWSSCWLGIATDALRRARSLVQKKARSSQNATPPGAIAVAELDSKVQLMRADLAYVTESYETAKRSGKGLGGMDVGLSLRLNNLKLNVSRMVREVVTGAIELCGISAYRNDSPFSLGRHLRDSTSAALMISNGRILESNAVMQMVFKGGSNPPRALDP